MSLNVVSAFWPAPRSRDWSNQEIAEFYRAEASLGRAGVSVETDRGLSDEGDPWLVFCRVDTGDVILHIARLDGEYIVASPALGSCARGRDFRSLMEALIESYPVVIAKAPGCGKLLIYPAGLLIVLVTTCFFKLQPADAAAAERGESAALPAGSSTHNTSSLGPQKTPTDERDAAAVLGAIAVAVAWAQSVDLGLWSLGAGPNANIELLPRESSGAASANSDSAFDALQVGQLRGHDLSGQPDMAGADLTTPFSALPPTLPFGRVSDSHSVIDHTSTGAGLSMLVSSLTPISTSGSSHSGATVPPMSVNQLMHPLFLTTGNPMGPTTATSAAQEASFDIGVSLAAHLVTDTSGAEQQIALRAATTAAPSEHSPSAVIIQATTVSTSNIGSPPTGNPTPSPMATPAEYAPSAAVTNGLIVAETAIEHFMVNFPDFQVISLKNEMIIYDPHLTPAKLPTAVEQVFDFQDGSSVVLIGLPTHAATPHLSV